jgi:glycerophosphoryl diester phosphodiesterase
LPFALLDPWFSPAPDPRRVEWIGRHSYAHRGLHGPGFPENSRTAIERAIVQGLGIEVDVRRSSDGHPMVFHDDELGRMTEETGLVARRTAAQLGSVALKGSTETIPSLRQVLAQIGGRVPILIEIKSRPQRKVAGVCLAVRRVLEGYTGLHAVMSFDPRVSRWYRKHSPHTVRGLVVTEGGQAHRGRVRRHLALWHARPDFLAFDIRDLPSRFADAQRSRGLPVATWTVGSLDHRQLAAAHADAEIFEGIEALVKGASVRA